MHARTIDAMDEDEATHPKTCTHCGDPLPVDGRCDCAGDADRDTRAGWRGLRLRPVLVRIAGTEEILEVWA